MHVSCNIMGNIIVVFQIILKFTIMQVIWRNVMISDISLFFVVSKYRLPTVINYA